MISEIEIIARLLLGALIGGIVGFERQVHGRPAGFRTHLLVCVAMVLLMVVSEHYHHSLVKDPSFMRVDPARIAMGAITGIGFLGAGVIIKTGSTVMGLTTAASIWTVSAIGLALGAGLYVPAVAVFLITFFALLALRSFEVRMPTLIFKSLTLIGTEDISEDNVIDVLAGFNAKVHNIDYEKDAATGEITYRITVAFKEKALQRKMLDSLSAIEPVKKVILRS